MSILRYFVVAAVAGAALAGCSSSSSGSGSGANGVTCAQVCVPQNAAHCPSDPPDCTGSCASAVAATPAACQSQQQSLLTCAVHATFTCDATGLSNPVGCDTQINAYAGCIAANPSGTTGGTNDGGQSTLPGNDAGGTMNPSGGACGANGTSCSDCVATSCCTETTACGADSHCSLLSTCLTRCISTDQSCTSACSNLYPDATSLYNNVSNCVSQSCTYACDTPPAGCTYVADPSADNCASTGFPLPWSCPGGAPQQQTPCAAPPDGAQDVYCCLQ
jgi:hypothetical protein